MDNKTNKATESLITCHTTSENSGNSSVKNVCKFIDFLETSNVSVQSQDKTSVIHSQPLANGAQDPEATETIRKKISLFTMNQGTDEPLLQGNMNRTEKSLREMGFQKTKSDRWGTIKQSKKDNLYKILKDMIENHINTNIQIVIGDTSFNCHVMVLQSYSEFFMETSDGTTFHLPEEMVTAKAFLMVYDWMLSPKPRIQREGILDLFSAATFLKIKELVDQCWAYFDDGIRFQEDTALLLYLEARNYGLETLQQLMVTRIFKFFLTLVSTKDFLLLSAKEVCALLSSNYIGVNSEAEILMSGIRWLNYNWVERQSHLLEIMNCVRFSLIPLCMLLALKQGTDCDSVDNVIDTREVKDMIEQGLTYVTFTAYFSDSKEEFLDYLERYELTQPVQRQWICDMECRYHHRIKCPNREVITYGSFLEYLQMIRSNAKEHWKTLKMENQEPQDFQCCTDIQAPDDQ